MESDKLLSRRRLANGMDLNYYDMSRKVAGDRWMVELKCEVSIPVLDAYYNRYQNVEPEMLEEIKSVLSESTSFSTSKERFFVPEEDRGKVLEELIEQADSTIFSYLNNPKFPERTCRKRIEETMEKLTTEKAMNSLTNQNSQKEEDEGPADFSFCFKD